MGLFEINIGMIDKLVAIGLAFLSFYQVDLMLEKIVNIKESKHTVLWKLLHALAGTAIIVLLIQTSLIKIPYIVVQIIPMLEMLFIFIRLNDSIYPFAFIYITVLVNTIFKYNLAIVFMRLVAVRFFAGYNLNYYIVTYIVELCISIVLVSFLLTNKKIFPTENIKELAHSKGGSQILFLVMCACSVGCIITGVLANHLIENAAFNRETIIEQCIEVLVWTLVAAITIYSLAIVESKRVISNKKLRLEMGFLRQTADGKDASYIVNITKDRIIEGGQIFSAQNLDITGSYLDLIRTFYERCVLPEDNLQLEQTLHYDFFEDKAKNEPSFFLSMRILPHEFLKYVEAIKTRQYLLENEDKVIWMQFHCVIVEDDQELFMFVRYNDISQEKEAEERLKKFADTDGLTGLANRRVFEEYVKNYLKQGIDGGCLILIDMDYFKQVNDTMGHQAGDDLLKGAAAKIKSQFREEDIVARLGGDEFVIFMPEIKDRKIIENKLSKLVRLGRQELTSPSGIKIRVSFSIGAAMVKQNGEFSTIYQNADEALYQIKEAGRDGYKISD